jgi:hypothetical protein
MAGRIRRSDPIRLGPHTVDELMGRDILHTDGSPAGVGWGRATVYAGTLENLGPLYPITAAAMASLALQVDMQRSPEAYKNGKLPTCHISHYCQPVYIHVLCHIVVIDVHYGLKVADATCPSQRFSFECSTDIGVQY